MSDEESTCIEMDKIKKRLIQSVVLLERQYLLTDHLINSRGPALCEFEEAIAEKRQELEHVLNVYSYVFSLIDHLVRYQKIAFVLPIFNHRRTEFRALNAAMGDLKDVRNQLQHVNNDIENDYSGPLLGAVCWASGQQQFMAIFNDIGRERSSPTIAFDTKMGKFAHNFCYVYNDKYYDLGAAIGGVRAFNKFISSEVSLEVGGKPYDPRDHFGALRFEFKKVVGRQKPK